MPSVRLSCGPKGITTMKSTMLKNWTAARINSKSSSRRRCSAGTTSFLPPSPSRINFASEDLSALKAFSVAIITSAPGVGFCPREFYAEDNLRGMRNMDHRPVLRRRLLCLGAQKGRPSDSPDGPMI